MIMSTKEICKRGLSMTISLTLGNTGFPGRYRLLRQAHHLSQFALGQPMLLTQLLDPLAKYFFCYCHRFSGFPPPWPPSPTFRGH